MPDVKIIQTEQGNAAYFDDWLSANGFVSHKLLQETMFNCGCLECEVKAWIEKLKEDFEDWCFINSVNGFFEKN